MFNQFQIANRACFHSETEEVLPPAKHVPMSWKNTIFALLVGLIGYMICLLQPAIIIVLQFLLEYGPLLSPFYIYSGSIMLYHKWSTQSLCLALAWSLNSSQWSLNFLCASLCYSASFFINLHFYGKPLDALSGLQVWKGPIGFFTHRPERQCTKNPLHHFYTSFGSFFCTGQFSS